MQAKDQRVQTVRERTESGVRRLGRSSTGTIGGTIYRDFIDRDVVKVALYGEPLKDFDWSVEVDKSDYPKILVRSVLVVDHGSNRVFPDSLTEDFDDYVDHFLNQYGFNLMRAHGAMRASQRLVYVERGPQPSDFVGYHSFRVGLVRVDFETLAVVRELGLANGKANVVRSEADQIETKLLDMRNKEGYPVMEVEGGKVSLHPPRGVEIRPKKVGLGFEENPERVAELVSGVVYLTLRGRPGINIERGRIAPVI